MSRILMLVVGLLLSGCASLDGLLTNRVTVSTAMDECQVSSRWGSLSIGSDIDKRDCEAIRQGMLLRILILMERRQPLKERSPEAINLGARR